MINHQINYKINKNNFIRLLTQKGGNMEEILSKLKFLRHNVITLKELFSKDDDRSLNYIAAYIINNSREVLSRVLTYSCNTNIPIHQCTYFYDCCIDIVTEENVKQIYERNKNCLESINKCLLNDCKTDYILPIRTTRRSFIDERKHFFTTLIIKKELCITIIIIDPYFSQEKKDVFLLSDYLLIELLKNNILMLKDANFINSSRDIDKMPQIITNDLSCQIWSIMYQYIYLCSNIDPNDNNLEKTINVNPFYYMMMFLTNIYDFYKSKDKDILEETCYDYKTINNFKYFNLRRQFLHLIENKCDSKFMKTIIENGQVHLTSQILEHILKFKENNNFNKYKSTLNHLIANIKLYGNISLFDIKLNKVINNKKGELKYYSNRRDNSTDESRMKEALTHEIDNLERTISILEDIK